MVPTLEALRSLSQAELRIEVADMLDRLGYTLVATTDAGELIVMKDDRKLVVTCARPAEPVRPQAIARLHETILSANAAAGFYVTARSFEPDAIAYAAGLPITPVDGEKLVASMRHSKTDAASPEIYKAMCKICGGIVEHRLSCAKSLPCGRGHFVAPTIARAALFPEHSTPSSSGGKSSPAPRARHRRMTPKAHNKGRRLAHNRALRKDADR